jgi:hypothetical protein
MIEKGPDSTGLTTYGLVKPFAHYTLQYLKGITDVLHSEWERDELDSVFLNKMELLGLQTLLFLSAYPLEYDTKEAVIRKPRLEGKHHIPGLYPAKFVGQSQIRPQSKWHSVASAHGGEPNYRLSAHWRRGHWKRQWFGPKHGQQKLIWIHPYKAGQEPEEHEK